jgi:hypothetical protein
MLLLICGKMTIRERKLIFKKGNVINWVFLMKHKTFLKVENAALLVPEDMMM